MAKKKKKRPAAKKQAAKAPKKKKAGKKKKTGAKRKAQSAPKRKTRPAAKRATQKGKKMAKKKTKKKAAKASGGSTPKKRGGKKGRKKSFNPFKARGGGSIVIRSLQRAAHGVEGVAAAKVTQFAISKLPIANPKIKSGLQALIGGLGGMFTEKYPWLKGLADGPYYIGLAGVAKGMGVETMAGDEDYHLVVDANGNVHEMSGDELMAMQGDINGEDDEDDGLDGDGFAMQGDINGDLNGDDFEMG